MGDNQRSYAELNRTSESGGNRHAPEWIARLGESAYPGEPVGSRRYTPGISALGRTQLPTTATDLVRLTSLLSIDPHKSRLVIVFPGFHMGFKRDEYERAIAGHWLQVPESVYYYRGKTSAMTAFGAVKGLVAMLGRIFDTDEIQNRVVFATDEQTELLLHEGMFTHYVMIGTRSHEYSRQILQKFSLDFEFSYSEDTWSVVDKREKRIYTVPDPSKTMPGEPIVGNDYALIEKIVDEATRRVVLVLGGMWDTGTLAAGNFLIEHRDNIYAKFGNAGFQYLLEVSPGSTQVTRVILERSPR